MNDEIEQQSFRIPDDFPNSIRGIISNLRNVVDQFATNSKELVIELARRLDEVKICERNKISRLIKYILKDKIREGKITAKWIEKCLPEEYKRDYSESDSFSTLTTLLRLSLSVVISATFFCNVFTTSEADSTLGLLTSSNAPS